MRARLCWNDHADKSEREGTFQRKYRMKRRTFKKLVALLRPALERDYCKNSVLAVSLTFKIDLYSSNSRSRAYKIRVCILQVLQQMDRFSLRGRRAYIAPSAVLVYPRSVNTVGWVCSSIY